MRHTFFAATKSTPDGAIERMQEITRAVGAVPQLISPHDHDRLVARISHLPQIISTVLADQTAGTQRACRTGLAFHDTAGCKSVSRLA